MPVCQQCFCHEGECNCYRFLRDYLSPNVPVTTLVITGNHPATLVANIEYQRAQQFGGDTWSCNIDTGTPDRKCCVSGAAHFNCEESLNVWQDSFCCQQTREGEISFDIYTCCNRPGTSNNQWIKTATGTISGSFGISTTVTHAVWYRRLAVRMYAGELDGCCGVWVEVCLTFVRLTPSVYDSEKYLAGSVTFPDFSCVGLDLDDQPPRTCTVECGTPVTGPIACPEPFDAEDLATVDCNTPLLESLGLMYSILRRKFVPGNPACTARDLPQLSITLTAADNVTQIIGCGPCGASQSIGGDFPDFCVPDRVYYDRGTYADASAACCGPAPSPVSCGGAGSRTSDFSAFLGVCHTQCDEDIEFGPIVWNCFDDSCTDDVPGVGSGTSVVSNMANRLAGCYPYPDPTSVVDITSRTNTVEDNCDIDPCDHLLFGEIDDTWTLTITLPS